MCGQAKFLHIPCVLVVIVSGLRELHIVEERERGGKVEKNTVLVEDECAH